MSRIRFDFATVALEAELLDTPTARAIAAALPISSFGAHLGRGGLFRGAGESCRGKDARAVVTPGEVAYWPQGHCIALGYGRTPISRGDETRLASPCNIFAQAMGDVKTLVQVKAGSTVKVTSVA